jgi:uncharacterized iron-regulated membrane protein
MKRIALTVLSLALSGGVAFAAAPSATTKANHQAEPYQQHKMQAQQTAKAKDEYQPPASTMSSNSQAMSGSHAMSGNNEAQRMTSALNLLEAKGYGSFNNFKRDGKDFTATVMKNGQSQTLRIDPDSGQITNQG